MQKSLRWLVGLIGALTVVLVSAGVLLADNELHDRGHMASGDTCALCHRVLSSGEVVPIEPGPNQDDICLACHDGSGAETDVLHGVLAGDTYGPSGSGLRGGGFLTATMDIDHDGISEVGQVTSTHTYDGATPGTMWGSGDIESSTADYGISHSLTCTDCHDPHGNDNYRLLRGRPYGMEDRDSATPVNVPDEEPTPVYSIGYTSDNYRDVSYAPQELDEWCAQCHTRYLAGPHSSTAPSGDQVFAYRHPTTSNGCLDCHVVHGTTASMGPVSSAVQYPDASEGPEGSTLLWLDSREVCLSGCHTADSLTAD